MKFGITFKPDMTVERILRLTRQAEQAGFEYAWIFDSHVLWMDPYPLMTLMAANTSRMRIGPCVTNPAVRDITVTASLFATLNLISGGRMDLGIGRGDSSRRVLGKKPVTPKELEQSIQAFRDLTAGREIQYDGQPTRITWSKHSPPVWVAGYGPKVLNMAGRVADGIILQFADPDLIEWCMGYVKEGAREAGRDPKSIEVMAAAPVWVSDESRDCARTRALVPCPGLEPRGGPAVEIPGAELPAALTSYVRDRGGYDYQHHCKVGSDNAEFRLR